MKTSARIPSTLVMLSLLGPLIFATVSNAADRAAQRAPAQTAAPQSPPAERSTSINFDDEIIEGMNKNPFDSLTSVAKRDDRSQGHLYHKKANFKREIRQTVREMGYIQ